jgi:DNA modification methylase
MTIPEHLIDTVYLGDVFDLMRQLPDKSVDMVFSDPDYNVGVRYNGKSYTRSFEEYIEWYIELARESLRVLKDDGNMFFINYPKQNAYLRVRFLDEACYEVQDYVWVYNTNVGHSPKRFTTAHRSICTVARPPTTSFSRSRSPSRIRTRPTSAFASASRRGKRGACPTAGSTSTS